MKSCSSLAFFLMVSLAGFPALAADTKIHPHPQPVWDLKALTKTPAIYPADGINAETLIKCADTAMYHAKEKGRNNHQFFRGEMNVRAVERQFIEANLRIALEKNNQFKHLIKLGYAYPGVWLLPLGFLLLIPTVARALTRDITPLT